MSITNAARRFEDVYKRQASDTMSTQAEQEMIRTVLQQMDEAEALLATMTKVC